MCAQSYGACLYSSSQLRGGTDFGLEGVSKRGRRCRLASHHQVTDVSVQRLLGRVEVAFLLQRRDSEGARAAAALFQPLALVGLGAGPPSHGYTKFAMGVKQRAERR